MSNELEPAKGKDIDWTTLENVIAKGDLSQLTPEDRTNYYRMVCEAVGLNPSTQPFEYLKLNNKLTLYATRRCTDQLRKVHRVSITRLEQIRENDLFIATAYASTPDGRVDSDVGAVGTQGLKGEALGNAIMKSITKSKRRVTLSICGLGFLDETEADTIPGATLQAEIPQNRYTPEETAQTVEGNAAAAVHAERIKNAGKVTDYSNQPDEAPEDPRVTKWREVAKLAQWHSDTTGEPPFSVVKRTAAALGIPDREKGSDYTVAELDRILEVLKQAPVPAQEATI